MELSGWRRVWLIVLFDLPVKTRADKFNYRSFHHGLLKDGFNRIQFSVYTRFCPSIENMEVHESRVKAQIPPEGEVRMLVITDKQYERMRIFRGKRKQKPEKSLPQLLLF
jgi:CRISPR-associated protein Cas2